MIARITGILSLVCIIMFCGCASRPRITDETLKHYPVGTPAVKMVKELGLDKFPYDITPNLPFGKEQGWYRLPEGDLMVSWSLIDGRPVLDTQPYILELKR
jgi:hypothetical protein